MINPVQLAAAPRNVDGYWLCFRLKPLQSCEVRDGPDIPLLPLVHPNSCRALLAVAWRLWGCTCARDYRAGRLWRGGDGARLVRFWIDVCDLRKASAHLLQLLTQHQIHFLQVGHARFQRQLHLLHLFTDHLGHGQLQAREGRVQSICHELNPLSRLGFFDPFVRYPPIQQLPQTTLK